MMWPRPRLIFWWLISAALVAASTAWLALRWHMRAEHDVGAVSGRAPVSLRDWLDSQEQLSDRQQALILALEEDYQKSATPLHESIRAAEIEIARVIHSGEEKSPALAPALERLAKAQSALQQLTVSHYFAVRKNLTPSQRAAFAQWNDAQLLRP